MKREEFVWLLESSTDGDYFWHDPDDTDAVFASDSEGDAKRRVLEARKEYPNMQWRYAKYQRVLDEK